MGSAFAISAVTRVEADDPFVRSRDKARSVRLPADRKA
jgi:hypothetical protein